MSDIDVERLHEALHDLAGEVHSVDLRERALRTSHRLAVRRLVLGSVAAAVVLAVTGAGLVRAFPVHRTAPLPAESGSPSPVVTVGPSPSAPPTSVPPTLAPVVPSGPFGALYYLDIRDASGSEKQTARLFAWSSGQAGPTELRMLDPLVAMLTANVSPDGRFLSWVDEGPDAAGLHVTELATGVDRVLRENVGKLCFEPVWAPDSLRLLISDRSDPSVDRAGTVDVATGEFTPLRVNIGGCHPRWAADGTALVVADGTGGVFVTDADGSNKRVVPRLHVGANSSKSFDPGAASVGGDRVALLLQQPGSDGGDAARDMFVNAVVDTRTGRQVALPVSGQLLQVKFRPDGTMVLRVEGTRQNKLVLVSAAGKVLTQQDEPAALKTMDMLST